MIKQNLKYFSIFIMVFVVCLQATITIISPDNKFSWVFSLLLWAVGLVIVRRSLPMLIFFGFIFSYIFVPYHFFFEGKIISGYSSFFHDLYFLNKVAIINSLFMVSMTSMLFNISDKELLKIDLWADKNSIVFYLSLFLLIPMIFYGASGDSILISGGYGNSTASKSAIYEYVAVLFIIPFIFYDGSKTQGVFLILLVIYYVGKTLMYGSRLEIIQIGLLSFFYFFDYGRNISKVKLLFILLVTVLMLKLWGDMRSNPIVFINSISSFSLFFDFFFSKDTNPYLMTNSGDVYYASMRLLGLIENGVLDFEYRLISFFSFVFNLPLSLSDLKNYSTLSSFKSDIYRTGGGGLAPIYFYVWVGYGGVIFGGILIGYVFKRFHSPSSLFVRVYGLAVLITFPRWFPYSPIGFVKINVILVFLYCLYLSLSSLLRNKLKA